MQTYIHQYAIGVHKFLNGNIIHFGIFDFVDSNNYWHMQNLSMAITVDNFVNIIK